MPRRPESPASSAAATARDRIRTSAQPGSSERATTVQTTTKLAAGTATMRRGSTTANRVTAVSTRPNTPVSAAASASPSAAEPKATAPDRRAAPTAAEATTTRCRDQRVGCAERSAAGESGAHLSLAHRGRPLTWRLATRASNETAGATPLAAVTRAVGTPTASSSCLSASSSARHRRCAACSTGLDTVGARSVVSITTAPVGCPARRR